MTIERFEDIRAWKAARELTSAVYLLTREKEFARDFGLRDQIQRAAVSIMANTAEGLGRRSNPDFIRFLRIAYSSALEVQSHLYVALDLAYIDEEQFGETRSLAISTARLTGGFINFLRNSPPQPPSQQTT